MSYYASIGGVRIQTWIARSASKLSLVRGASILLSTQTANTEVESWLKSYRHVTVEVAAEAGDVDGVVVLKASDRKTLRAAAEGLIVHLEAAIPGLQWEGWVGEGETYLDAYARHGGAPPSIRSMPTLPELGLVQTCGFCSAESATGPLTIGDEKGVGGRSCIARKKARDGQNRAAQRGWLWEDIPGDWANTFEDLARMGGRGPDVQLAVGRKDSRSHLATVAADGNGIGALFRSISELGLDELRREAVQLLNEATTAAVSAAAQACGTSPSVKVVIPHYVGGDDVFASVAAPAIWTFAVNLGRRFEKLREQLKQLVPVDRNGADDLVTAIERLGLGIGVALAGRSVPISTTSEAAHSALGAAKAATRGGESAIGWVDLTAAADVIHTVTIEDVEKELGNLNPVFRLPASARASLAALVRSQPIDSVAAVDRWSQRTGNPIPSGIVPALPATLSRARWWPNLPEEA